MMQAFLTRRWILTTLLVIGGVALCVRLGFWQLDRLAWRRAFNTRVEAQINAPQLDLNRQTPSSDALSQMEYRSVTVTGTYDFSQEIILRNQVYDNQLGYHVFTPLRVAGSDLTILVERGWLPADQSSLPARTRFEEAGQVSVSGVLRQGLNQPDYGGAVNPTLSPGETHLDAWNYINLDQIQAQTSLKLVPVYLQQAPDPAWTKLPYRQVNLPEITEGPHEGYAIQWFSFATLLGGGYPFFVRRMLVKKTSVKQPASNRLENQPEAISKGL
jgi:surfeit locus 1 family protein